MFGVLQSAIRAREARTGVGTNRCGIDRDGAGLGRGVGFLAGERSVIGALRQIERGIPPYPAWSCRVSKRGVRSDEDIAAGGLSGPDILNSRVSRAIGVKNSASGVSLTPLF